MNVEGFGVFSRADDDLGSRASGNGISVEAVSDMSEYAANRRWDRKVVTHSSDILDRARSCGVEMNIQMVSVQKEKERRDGSSGFYSNGCDKEQR